MQKNTLWWRVFGAACLIAVALSGTTSAQAATAANSASRAVDLAPVDINKASAEGLAAIPGIGRVTAERIVAWREQNGPFRRVEDLMKVKGIGEKSFDKIRPYVKVSKGR